ncbi:MAG: carboxypeptidase-like regulatory domain-containing protein [Desulfurococcaceae archaeon]
MPWFTPSSRSLTLTVAGGPKADWSYYPPPDLPEHAKPGVTINFNADLVNAGDSPGYLFLDVFDQYGKLIASVTSPTPISPGDEWSATAKYTMESRDIEVLYSIGHLSDSSKVGDKIGKPNKNKILYEVETTIDLYLSPSTVPPGGTVRAYGYLWRRDTGAGISGKTIAITVDTVVSATTTTGADGFFEKYFTAPTTPKTYTVTASFAGGANPGGGYLKPAAAVAVWW